MGSNTFGDNFRVTTFGESHGPAVGVVIDGVRPGVAVDIDAIQQELDRRKPGTSKLTSPRKESDRVNILSGLFEGKTTGAPIALVIFNENQRPGHYEQIKDLFRPGHADFTWWKKFGIRDWRGGGRTSGRETAARVAAGAIAKQLLSREGVRIVGHVVQIGDVHAASFEEAVIETNAARCADAHAAAQMAAAVEAARKQGDSLGGVVEVVACGVPAGWGDPVFQKLDAALAAAMVSIGAIKGVEFGDGFQLSRQRGSQANDPIRPAGFLTNHMGGILGGISNGEPIVVRLAVKPTSSIRAAQETIDTQGRAQQIVVKGRHDPCICPRVVPVAETMMALVLVDAFLRQQAITQQPVSTGEKQAELAYCDSALLQMALRRKHLAQAFGEDRDGVADIARGYAPLLRQEAIRQGLTEAEADQLVRRVTEITDL